MFQSLERHSGLPIAFDPTTNSLQLTEGIVVDKHSDRTEAEMKEYTADPNASAPHEAIYSMYRNVHRESDTETIRNSHLRYDITVMASGVFSGTEREYMKTAGHYHALKPGTSIHFPEIYEVISGRAYWLLQRTNQDPGKIEEIYLVEGEPGDKILMVPGFGHMLINAFREPLITSNWINDTFTYDYTPYRNLRGSGYWVVEGPNPDIVGFSKNQNYTEVPELKKLRPREIPELGIEKNTPLYNFARNLEKLDFLSNPERYIEWLTIEHCFRPVH